MRGARQDRAGPRRSVSGIVVDVATEIERKFLVAGDGWRAGTEGPPNEIRQGYLSRGPAAEVRVRQTSEGGFLTIKGGQGAVRTEHEWPIAATEADELLAASLPSVLHKTRWRVPDNTSTLVWEVDEYHGDPSGLLVAEVELDSVDQAVDLPDWIGRELTGDKRYSNAALSAHGVPSGGPPVYVASPLGFTEP